MRRILAAIAVGAAALTLTLSGAQAQDKKKKDDKKKEMTIKDVMKAQNGKTGLGAKLSAAAKAEKWEDAEKIGKQFKELGDALAKQTPPKGEKESWEKLTKAYSEAGTAAAEAAGKKDGKALADAAKHFNPGASCKDCHSAHK
jgi:hypothetical protein